jgi:hypothetical protein
VLRRTGIGPVVVIARPVVVVVVSARPFVVVTGTIVVVVPTGPVLIVDAAATTTGTIGRDGLRRGFDHAGTGGERRRPSRGCGRGSGQRSRSNRRIVGLVVRPLVLMIIVPTSATSATGAVVVLVRIVVVIGMVGPVLVRVVRAVVTTT